MTRDEAMKVWREADRAGEDAYVDAIQAGAVTADDAHKAGSLAAATVIQQAFAERDGEMRLQGQAEGFAGAVQWLRDRGAMKPPATLWHAAEILADQMEQSRIAAKGDSRG